MADKWRVLPSGCADSGEGFWLGIHAATGDLEIHFGGDEHTILPIAKLKRLYELHSIKVLTQQEYSGLQMWQKVAEEQAIRDGREIVRLRVALENVEHELQRLKALNNG